MDSARSPVSAPEFWQGLYAEGQDGWELGAPTPALEAWLDEGGAFSPLAAELPARIAVPYPLREGTDGPPFPVSREEIERVLAPGFVVRSAHAPARSVERRRGLEWLVLAERN